MTDRKTITHRIAAGLAIVPAATCTAVGALLGPDDLDWAPVWGALALMFVWVAWSLWSERPHGRAGAAGLAIGGLLACVQGTYVVGLIPLLAFGLFGHAAWTASVLSIPRELDRRHETAVALATAAIPCAIVYGLGPQQELSTALWMLGGAGAVWVSAIGISRDKTWGLLVAPLAAAVVASTVMLAPRCGCMENPHPMMPQAGFAVAGLGVAAAVLSAAVFVVYLGPMIRWLRR